MDNGFEKINIQWYPGHMTKAKRMIDENLNYVDAVCEILDARIPLASSNPDIGTLAQNKPRLIILNRSDLADPDITDRWVKYFEKQLCHVLVVDSKSGKGVNQFVPAVKNVLKDKIAAYEEKGQSGRPLRIMILGIPNVGKSTFINKVARRKAAIAGDKPGVTRGKQWISIDEKIDLLDTPGILWPKFDSQEVGELLALTNAIKTEVFDFETLACNFMLKLKNIYPESIVSRYKIEINEEDTGYDLLQKAALKRGMLISKGEADTNRMAIALLKEYHEGKLGRLSLEVPDE